MSESYSEFAPHPKECKCRDCVYWFAGMQQLTDGLHSCAKPVDDHTLSVNGRILQCPKQVTA